MSIENSGNIVKTFMDLVRIDSPTFHEEEMAGNVRERLSGFGLSPEIDKEGNILVFLAGDNTKEPYLLNAHLDTVQQLTESVEPFIDIDGWIRPKGNTILGADNKTAVAAILETISILTQEKNTTHHPLEVVFTVSEESGNHGAHGLDYGRLSAKKGFVFDAGGHNFGDLIIASPFYNRFDLKLIGRDAHASRPELANNVLPIFARSLLKLPLGRVSDTALVNIGIVSVGEVGGPVNTIPGELVISGEVRGRSGEEIEAISANILGAFQKEAQTSNAVLDSKLTRENDGYAFSKDDSFVTKTAEVLNEMGINPELVESWGCYDANIFAFHGIMALNIADGSINNHTSRERVKVTDLNNLQNLIYKLVTQ